MGGARELHPSTKILDHFGFSSSTAIKFYFGYGKLPSPYIYQTEIACEKEKQRIFVLPSSVAQTTVEVLLRPQGLKTYISNE